MSNRVTIESNEFGFTIFDDYDRTFIAFDHASEITDYKTVLEHCLNNIEKSNNDLLWFCWEMEKGMYINDNWYDYSELKDVFDLCEENPRVY